MLLSSIGGQGVVYSDFSVKSAENIFDEKNTVDSQKLEIISELFLDKDKKELVKNEQENLILRRSLKKFSSHSLEKLCQLLGEIFKGYTDPVRANILQKFLDADECDWPDLLTKELRWRYLLKINFPLEAEVSARLFKR